MAATMRKPASSSDLKSSVVRSVKSVPQQTWNRPVAVSTSTSREPLPSSAHPGVEIEYRGLWQVFDDQVYTAKIRQAEAEVALQHVMDERDLLRFENEELNIKFKETLASLTETSSSHLEAQQILHQIRLEKENLTSRVSALESHQDWLEQQNRKIQENLQFWQRKFETSEKEKADLKVNFQELTKSKQTADNLNKSKDEQIAKLSQELHELHQEFSILEKSRITKDRLYQHTLKERDTLKTEIEELKKQLHQPMRRRGFDTTMTTPRADRQGQIDQSAGSKIRSAARGKVVKAEIIESAVEEVTVTPQVLYHRNTSSEVVPDFLTGDAPTPNLFVNNYCRSPDDQIVPPTPSSVLNKESNPWGSVADTPMKLSPKAILQSPSPSSTSASGVPINRPISRMKLRRNTSSVEAQTSTRRPITPSR